MDVPKEVPHRSTELVWAHAHCCGAARRLPLGGQGKKPSEAVYSLDPDTVTWAQVDTKGVR